MDIVVLFLLFVALTKRLIDQQYQRYKFGYNEGLLIATLSSYLIVAGIAVIRGYFQVGTWAIGVGRYSILEAAYIPIILIIINSEYKVALFLRILGWALPIILVAHTIVGMPQLGTLLAGNSDSRFIGAATMFGIATIATIIFSAIIDKRMRQLLFPSAMILPVLLCCYLYVMLLQHRSVWVSTIIGLLVLLILHYKRTGTRFYYLRIITALSVIILFVSVAAVFIPSDSILSSIINERLSFLRGAEYDTTGFWRIRGWITVIFQTWNNAPIIGFGFTRSGWIDFTGAIIDVWEHNQYVHFFRATGLVGIFTYCTFLGVSLRYGWKTVMAVDRPLLKAVGEGAFAGLVMNICYMMFYNQVTFLWLCVAILIVVNMLNNALLNRT